MPEIDTKSNKPLDYPSRTLERAERSLLCSPFKYTLFATMLEKSVSLSAIAGKVGAQNGYTKRPLSELSAENALTWLIQVGVLRREVDGQGITDSFRLTPLGRQLIEHYQPNWRYPSWLERVYNALNRWLRLPF